MRGKKTARHDLDVNRFPVVWGVVAVSLVLALPFVISTEELQARTMMVRMPTVPMEIEKHERRRCRPTLLDRPILGGGVVMA